MLEKKKEKELVRNFLKENDLVKFSIRELTDLFCKSGYFFESRDRTYQYVYRGLCRLESEGWLVSEGEKRSKRYLVVHKSNSLKGSGNLVVVESPNCINELKKEKSQTEAELAILLGEIDEYGSLIKKHEKLFNQIQPLLISAREDSAKLLGKVNALNNVLLATNNGSEIC